MEKGSELVVAFVWGSRDYRPLLISAKYVINRLAIAYLCLHYTEIVERVFAKLDQSQISEP